MKHRLWRGAMAILATITLFVATTAPASAYAWDGSWYYNSAIADSTLSVCFGSNTSDTIYINRTQMLNELAFWNQAISGLQFYYADSNQWCDTLRNLNVVWGNCNNSRAVACFPVGEEVGGSAKHIYINTGYDTGWGAMYWGAAPVPSSEQDMASIVLHETGHALGLAHDSSNAGTLNAADDAVGPNVMSSGGPNTSTNCAFGYGFLGQRVADLGKDDWYGLVDRYPGLTPNWFAFNNYLKWQAQCVT